MKKLIEEVIQEAETFHNKGHFIYPRNFKKILESSGLDFIFIDRKSYPVKEELGEGVSMLIQVQGVTLKYSYSPGLGSFPNSREKITAYGTESDIQHVKDELDHKRKELGY